MSRYFINVALAATHGLVHLLGKSYAVCDTITTRAVAVLANIAFVILSSTSPQATAAISFQDDFNAMALDGAKWRQLAFHGPTAVPNGTSIIFNSQNYADTCGKYTFSGTGGITVEARMRGPGTNRDVTIQLVDATTGDTIAVGDTTYFGSMYIAGSGQFSATAFGGFTTPLYKEYRLTVSTTSVAFDRGDTLSSISESINAPLASTVEGKSFYLKIGAGGPLYFPSEFDWIRVNGVLTTSPLACPAQAFVGGQSLSVPSSAFPGVALANPLPGKAAVCALNATGLWDGGPTATYGPNGQVGVPCGTSCPMPDVAGLSLIAMRLNSQGQITRGNGEVVGAARDVHLGVGESIQLLSNDCETCYADNSGAVQVTAACTEAVGTVITDVIPLTASLDEPTTFSVRGAQLPAGLGFNVQDCSPANMEVIDASSSSTLRKFRCTPRGSSGAKTVIVKTMPNGTVLKSANVVVTPVSVAALPHHFSFDSSIGTQIAGVPVPVQISARDAANAVVTGFNSPVRLADDFGKTLSRSSITFANGVFSGNVTVLSAGRARLSLAYSLPTGALASGSSTDFNVTTATSRAYTLEVKVGLEAATASLTSGGSAYASAITDASGKAVFSAVPQGTYRIAAAKAGWQQASLVDADIVLDKDRTLTLNMTQVKRPVLIVPGMMGSTLKASAYVGYSVAGPRNFGDHVVGVSPKLPIHKCDTSKPCELASDLEIYDPTVGNFISLGSLQGFPQGHADGTAMGSGLLIDSLSTNFAVYPAPWDWRHNIEEAWKIYLKPKIDEAKRATGYDKVDVVAHSMGGLVTRAYIQSEAYANDIDRFIMIGTPNRGSTNAYYLMEGGQALELDSLVNTRRQNNYADIAFYAGAVNELYRTYQCADIYTLSDDGAVQNDSDYQTGQSAATVRSFLSWAAPGGRDLLPEYPFLRKWTATWFGLDKDDFEAGTITATPDLNLRLKALNANANVSRFVPIETSAPLLRTDVRTHIFLSNDKDTLGELGYSTLGGLDGQYPLGIPNYLKKAKGDQTVLLTSGETLFLPSPTKGAYGTHAFMLGAIRDDVLAKLTANRTFAKAAELGALGAVAPKASSSSTAPTLVMGIGVDGAFTALLTSPVGQQAGTVAATGVVLTSIPDSDVDNQRYQNRISVKDPVDGQYALSLAADSSLLLTGPRVSIDYATPAAGTLQASVRFIKQAGDRTMSVLVDRAAQRVVRIVDTVGVPTGLRATQVDGLTHLNWIASSDAAVVGYRIYSRLLTETVFQVDGTVSSGTASFATARDWASSEADAREFVVVAYAASGEESLIRGSNATTNRTFVNAQFTSSAAANGRVTVATPLPYTMSFVDQSTASTPINSWAWDFNADGVTDSTEQNPSFTFPNYGQYSVNLKVTSDDGEGARLRPAYVNIVPCAPLTLQTSCGLDVNGDGRIDSTDGVLILRRLLGFSGAALTSGFVSDSCAAVSSTHSDIASFIDDQVANGHYNIDGAPAGGATATSAGMLIVRALQGLSDNAVTTGAVRSGATRTTWTGSGQIRDYLISACGASLR